MQDFNYNNYIVKEDIREIRFLSALHMRDKFLKYIIGVFLFFIFTEWVPDIIGYYFPKSTFDIFSFEISKEIIKQSGDIPFATFLYALVFSGIFLAGRALYLLKFLRNNTCDYASLFDGISILPKAITLFLVQTLIYSVGLIFFVLPGIIAFYNYRQSFYILMEDPKKHVIKCLVESRAMMRGNKMQLFQLDFSFILMFIIALFPSVYCSVTGFMNVGDPSSLSGIFSEWVLRIPYYYVMGHWFMSNTVFYELLVSKGFKNFMYKGEKVFRERSFSK